MDLSSLSQNERHAFESFNESLKDRTGNSYETYRNIYPGIDVLRPELLARYEPEELVSAFIRGGGLKDRHVSKTSLEATALFNRQNLALRDFALEMNPHDTPDNWRMIRSGGIARQIEPDRGLFLTVSLEKDGSSLYSLHTTRHLRISEQSVRNFYEMLPTPSLQQSGQAHDINSFADHVLLPRERQAILESNRAPAPKIDNLVTLEINNIHAQRELAAEGRSPSSSPSPQSF